MVALTPSAQTQELRELTDLANTARSIFIPILEASIGTNATRGTCAYATFLTKKLFDSYTYYETFPRGGDGAGDGGYFDSAGVGHGHYWLEVTTPGGSFIVDITADQFNDHAVVVVPVNQCWQYIAGDQQLVDAHFRDISTEIIQSFEGI